MSVIVDAEKCYIYRGRGGRARAIWVEGCLGEGSLRELGDGARMMLRCAGSAIDLSLEPSWSDAGGALRPPGSYWYCPVWIPFGVADV